MVLSCDLLLRQTFKKIPQFLLRDLCIRDSISSGVKTNSFREEFVLNNNVIEKDITLFDLKSAENIWLGSHFTGLKKVMLHKCKGVEA
ncbi:hypothetical protein XNC3_620010 [Xenorhabdus nematophila F1]|nr:hypothetical protein XNC3_620010 [Xenorhabdus nematophila F1]CEE92766.1 hypothetical protein XNA1_3090019 [Xenorhabdus nematophila str. Anatoliense]